MSAYASYVKLTAKPGQRDSLVELMLEAAAGMETVEGCELYVINLSVSEPDSIWVTEIWRNQEDHDASLKLEGAQEQIQRVLPLLAGRPEGIILQPVGGKGFIPPESVS